MPGSLHCEGYCWPNIVNGLLKSGWLSAYQLNNNLWIDNSYSQCKKLEFWEREAVHLLTTNSICDDDVNKLLDILKDKILSWNERSGQFELRLYLSS